MTTVILYGAQSDTSISLPMCRALEKAGGVIHFCNGTINEYAISRPRFLLYETDQLENLQLSDCILLFKPSASAPTRKPSVCKNAVLIAEGENEGVRKLAAELGLCCITCGMSSRDTLVISSMGETEANISVRSEIQLEEAGIEPRDLTAHFLQREDAYALLARCAVLLIATRGMQEEFELM